jgi:hypothetical protein
MGVHRFPVLQHQHAEQLGVCLQHLSARAHYPAQLRQRYHHAGRRREGEAVLEAASYECCDTYGWCACECLGGFDEQGKSGL